MAGSFSKLGKTDIKIKVPRLNVMAHIFAPFHISGQKSNYNVSFGWDLLWEYGINLDFQNNFVAWKETKIPLKSVNCNMRTNFAIQDSALCWDRS